MVSRWWAVALLSLSVGLNLGLAVAVVQQRLAPAPQPAPPTVIVMPSPATAAPVESVAGSSPAPVNEVAPPSVAVASPIGAAPPQQRQQPSQPPREAPANEPLVPLEEAFDLGPPGGHDAGEPGPGGGGLGGPGAGPRGGGPSPARLDELARRLGVPERDRPRFVELQRSFLAETKTRRIQLETVRQGLRGELTAPQPNVERLHALVDASARLQGALERAFVEHVLQAREILEGEAEQRYLKFLARLGPRAVAGIGPPPPGQGQGRPLDPRWQRDRPWGGGRGGGFGGGGRRPPPGGQRAPFGEPRPAPSPNY